MHEQRHAQAGRHYADEILREQDRIAAADIVLLQFPIWWYGPPAVLKGWADRVLTHGFAYTDTQLFDTGLLAGKRAMATVTTGGTREELEADAGITGSPEDFLRPVTGGILRFVGMTLLPTFWAYAPAALDAAGRQALLADHARHLEQVLSRPAGCTARAGSHG